MKVRIGIADTDRVIELETDDPTEYEKSVEEAFSGSTALLWFEDAKGHRVGVPRERIAYVEVETKAEQPSVGFAPVS